MHIIIIIIHVHNGVYSCYWLKIACLRHYVMHIKGIFSSKVPSYITLAIVDLFS